MFAKYANGRMNACMNELWNKAKELKEIHPQSRFLQLRFGTLRGSYSASSICPGVPWGERFRKHCFYNAQFKPIFFRKLSGINLDRRDRSLLSSLTPLITCAVVKRTPEGGWKNWVLRWLGRSLSMYPSEAGTVLRRRFPTRGWRTQKQQCEIPRT